LPFGVSPLVNCSDAELKLLLLEHRGEQTAGNGADTTVVVLVVMLVVVLIVTMSLPMVLVLLDFRKEA
jgi:hypothetical protein